MRQVTGDDVAKVIRASGIAAIFDYVVQAAGVQTGVLGQRFQDERQVGINRTGPMCRTRRRQARLSKNTRHAVTVDVELRGDGADWPASLDADA